jgi:hypothetical protein
MPNANITIYFTDEEYIKYSKNKKQINSKARELVKKEVSSWIK